MKKIYSLLMLLCFALPMMADNTPINITVNTNNGDLIHVQTGNGTLPNPLAAGDNVIEVVDAGESYGGYFVQMNIYDKSYEIVSVVNETKNYTYTSFDQYDTYLTARMVYLYLSPDNNGDKIVITTSKLSQWQVNLKADKGGIISYYDDSYNRQTLNEGDNWFTIAGQEKYFSLTTVSNEYRIATVKMGDNDVEEVNSNYWYQTVGNQYEGKTIEFTTINLNETREASDKAINVKIDKPADVKLSFSPSYISINTENLPAGEWTSIKYIENLETVLSVQPKDWDGLIYQVLLNGELQTSSYGSNYSIYFADGDSIEINVAFPDVDAPVSIVFANEGTEESITGVKVNDESVESWKDGFSAKLGSNVTLLLNKSEYSFNSIVYNETNELGTWSTEASFTLTGAESNVVVVNSKRIVPYDFTLNVDNAANVAVYRGSRWDDEPYTDLVDGENKLQISSEVGYITIFANDGFQLDEVTYNGEAVDTDGGLSCYIEIEENAVVSIKTAAMSFDNTMVLWIKNIERADYVAFYSWDTDHSWAYNPSEGFDDLAEGYNVLPFRDADCGEMGFFMTASNFADDDVTTHLYRDGEEVEYMWGYSLGTVDDGTVLKFYIDCDAVVNDVTFSCSTDDVKVIADLVTPVLDLNGTVKMHQGTQLQITGEDLSVLVNNVALEAVDGEYTLVIDGDTKIVISDTSGIENVTVSDKTDGAIYNLQGIKLGNADQFENLPAGIYIVNGQKVRK